MKVRYDRKTDTLSLVLRDNVTVVESDEDKPGVILDYDKDGCLDLYVADDSSPSMLYHNNCRGGFTEVGVEAGVAYSADGREQAGGQQLQGRVLGARHPDGAFQGPARADDEAAAHGPPVLRPGNSGLGRGVVPLGGCKEWKRSCSKRSRPSGRPYRPTEVTCAWSTSTRKRAWSRSS